MTVPLFRKEAAVTKLKLYTWACCTASLRWVRSKRWATRRT